MWVIYAAVLAILPSMCLLGLASAYRRPKGARAGSSRGRFWRYGFACLCANFAWGAQLVATWGVIAGVLGKIPWAHHATVLVWTLLNGALVLDAILFVLGGLRLQRSLLEFSSALTEFADKLPWRKALFVALIGLAIYGATLDAFFVTAQPPDLAATLACMVVFALLAALASALRAGLPLDFAYEWDNRIVGAQLKLWRRTIEPLTKPAAVPVPTNAKNLLTRNVKRPRPRRKPAIDPWLFDARGVPHVFAPTNESAEAMDPAFPLLRRTTQFQGTRNFSLARAADERPHVVFIFCESLRAADVGALGSSHKTSVTPCLDELAREGVLWTHFYANGTVTSRALMAALYGILPDFRKASHQGAQNPPALVGMPQLFAQRGYLPAYFCDGPLDWENERDFFLNHGFPLLFGAPSIRAAYPDAPDSGWSFSDEFLMHFHADWLEAQDAKGQPTFTTVMTITNHMPWEAPPNAPFPDVDVDPKSEYGRFLRTTQYTDRCLGDYMQRMRRTGLDRKTVFFILGDHGQQVEDNRVRWSGRYNDGAVRVPLLMLAPGRVQPTVIDEAASQIDLLPTVMDLFDISAVHHSMGASLARRNAGRTAITIHPWTPGMMSNRVGRHRFVFSFEARKAALFDLQADPSEARDIASEQPQMVAEQTQLAYAIRHWLNHMHAEAIFAPASGAPPPGPHARLLGAPTFFPTTYEACIEHAERLAAAYAEHKLSRREQHDLAAFTLAVHAHGLDEVQKLRLAQLFLARVHVQTMGEPTRTEMMLLAQLDAAIAHDQVARSAPPWFADMARNLRGLAGVAVRT